ncbi:CMP-N-acetylneuraminic acid synthetase [Alcanivorax sp. N3-2A]|nr:CMP-N-acetylneuraminic acid synthetase [Alcanivorax sp. N3-2A]|tara:strand:- start:53805 stop:54500 length:696 start_codon:yes stop_codon:yes gene_type:complete
MIEGKSVLALITARGGSKGIPGKNIKPLAGKPLIAWSIEAARASRYLDRLVVSSDAGDILEVARRYGAEVPFTRPEALAADDTGSMEVILHALQALDQPYDYLLLLQPTSPFRTAADIDDALEQTVREGASLTVSVARLKKHPMFMYKVEGGKLVPFLDNAGTQLRRQDMPAAFEHNGALYIARVPYLLQARSFNTPEATPYVMDGPVNLDIDTPEDWEQAERLAARLGLA